MKGTITVLLALAFVTTGCAKRPGVAGVRMVVYQRAGLGHLPMPWKPLRGQPWEIISRGDVQAITDALNHPDGKAFTRMGRNDRLAIVGQDGRVTIYGITSPDPIVGGCDITPHQSSRKLVTALPAALARARVVKLALASPVQSLSYHDAGGTTRQAPANSRALQELLGHYSPLALKGNVRCDLNFVQDYSRRVLTYFEVKLSKPSTFEAVIVPKDMAWPPEVRDTSARLEKVEFDIVRVFHEARGSVRFVFIDSRSGNCLFTDPVNSLRLVKKAQGRTPPVYGPDLFDELASAATKP
jgi:hypothetical protein